MKIVPIQKARLLDGAKPFKARNVNATYRAQILCGDGSIKNAILKDLDQRELGIEMLIAGVGKLLGFPIPNAYLVVSDKTLPTSIGPEIAPGIRLMFASEDACSPPLLQLVEKSAAIRMRLLQRLAGFDATYSLFAFDTWTANVDRHPGNLLLAKDGIWFIDHGRCFGGPTVSFATLDACGSYKQKITFEIANVLTDVQKSRVVRTCAEFPSTSALLDAAQLLSQGDIEEILGSVEFKLATKFLNERRAHVPKLGAKLVGREVLL